MIGRGHKGIPNMADNAEIVTIKIRREMDGYFVATSAECPGLVLAHKEMAPLIRGVAPAIVALYKANLNIDVRVVEAFPAYSEEIKTPPAWVITRTRQASHMQ